MTVLYFATETIGKSWLALITQGYVALFSGLMLCYHAQLCFYVTRLENSDHSWHGCNFPTIYTHCQIERMTKTMVYGHNLVKVLLERQLCLMVFQTTEQILRALTTALNNGWCNLWRKSALRYSLSLSSLCRGICRWTIPQVSSDGAPG